MIATAPTPAFDGGYMDPPTPADALPLTLFMAAILDPADSIEVRAYDHAGAKSIFLHSWELPYRYNTLRALNQAGRHISIGINPRESRGDKAVRLARCVWVDGDGITVAELEERRERAGLPPFTLIVFSGHGVHGYWRLEIPVENLAAWKLLMLDLAAALDTDRSAATAEKVMRAPGFLNLKADPVLCHIVACDCTHRVSWSSIRQAIPTRVKAAPPPPKPIDMRDAGDPAKRCAAYLKQMDPSIAGSGGHRAAFRVACKIIEFGLGDSDGWALLQNWNAEKADPPWSERELRHKFDDAQRLAKRGVKLAGRAE